MRRTTHPNILIAGGGLATTGGCNRPNKRHS
jgi:hypothetical protein